MNPNGSFERDLERWLQAEAPARAPEGLHAAVIDLGTPPGRPDLAAPQGAGKRLHAGLWLLDHTTSFGDLAVPAYSARAIPNAQSAPHPFVTQKSLEWTLRVAPSEDEARALADYMPETQHGKLLSNPAAKAVLAGIAAIVVKKMMGGGGRGFLHRRLDVGLVELDRVGERLVPRAGVVAPVPDVAESAYRAIVLGIRDYVGKHAFPGVVIGLSGGIDSGSNHRPHVLLGPGHFVLEHEYVERDIPLHAPPVQILHEPGQIRPGEVVGPHARVEFLQAEINRVRAVLDGGAKSSPIHAVGKDVVVIGGGDTGTDCVGTALRQGCRSLQQIEIMPQPPMDRAGDNPWPEWPKVHKLDYGQEEAAARFGRPADPWRLRAYTVIFEADTRAGRLFDLALIATILASVLVVILDSVGPITARYGTLFDVYSVGRLAEPAAGAAAGGSAPASRRDSGGPALWHWHPPSAPAPGARRAGARADAGFGLSPIQRNRAADGGKIYLADAATRSIWR